MSSMTGSTTRRQVLVSIAQLALAATLASCSRSASQPAATAGNTDLELLASVVFDVLPFPELPAELYVRTAQQILELRLESVVAGLKTLRAAAHGTPWKDVAEDERVAILTSLQGTPFFGVLRSNTLQVLLRDPATFPIVGYGGSSMQYGGYLARGFDDIDWLPAPTAR
jgi:hypothetical protein